MVQTPWETLLGGKKLLTTLFVGHLVDILWVCFIKNVSLLFSAYRARERQGIMKRTVYDFREYPQIVILDIYEKLGFILIYRFSSDLHACVVYVFPPDLLSKPAQFSRHVH